MTLLIASSAQAAAVGRFTMVEGAVEVLHHGKVPAVTAKLNDGVEAGDVIRTKSKAKAQVKFVDDSFVTMAPDSRITVADFTYNAATRERHAVLRFFKGVMHTVVTQLIKVQEPDFITETHTAVLGVRGTEIYTVLLPNGTAAYLVSGLLEARSNNPQISGTVLLNPMEFSLIPLGQPARLPRKITPAMLATLKALMDTGLKDAGLLGAGAGLGGESQIPEILDLQRDLQPVIPPKLLPPVPPPTPQPQGGTITPPVR